MAKKAASATREAAAEAAIDSCPVPESAGHGEKSSNAGAFRGNAGA